MAIYIKQGSKLIEMTERRTTPKTYSSNFSRDHPNLLVGEQEGEQRKRWLLVQRKIGIGDEPDSGGRWSLDHLFLDEADVPTLVEVKRSSDTRIRREVVGQMLDYAANAASDWAVDQIRDAFETERPRGRP